MKMRTKNINHLQVIAIMLLLITLACNNKSRQSEQIASDDQPTVEHTVVDTASSVQEEVPKIAAPVSSSSSSSHSQKSINYDNMRGFDPASEDDIDDNGMSRYMENDDEEGWD